MELEEFVIKGAERYVALREQFPDNVRLRIDLNKNILDHIRLQRLPGEQELKYTAMYYSLRG